MKTLGLVILMVISILFTGCPPFNGNDPMYAVMIYYKNDKGEDLLDPATVGHYNQNDIRINGYSMKESNFSIDSTQNSSYPKGFALSFDIWQKGNSDSIGYIILLNTNTIDTLSVKASKTQGTLISCKYDKVDVLPANLPKRAIFPIEIVK